MDSSSHPANSLDGAGKGFLGAGKWLDETETSRRGTVQQVFRTGKSFREAEESFRETGKRFRETEKPFPRMEKTFSHAEKSFQRTAKWFRYKDLLPKRAPAPVFAALVP